MVGSWLTVLGIGFTQVGFEKVNFHKDQGYHEPRNRASVDPEGTPPRLESEIIARSFRPAISDRRVTRDRVACHLGDDLCQ